jgi:hypothetical protein
MHIRPLALPGQKSHNACAADAQSKSEALMHVERRQLSVAAVLCRVRGTSTASHNAWQVQAQYRYNYIYTPAQPLHNASVCGTEATKVGPALMQGQQRGRRHCI